VDDTERLYGPRYPIIREYVDILSTQGVEWGLLGPREVDRLWERHILNSVALADLIPEGCGVADVGSGAGLPGIPLAVLRPDLEMTLIEPLLRRSRFLTHTVENLGITDTVRVVRSRAEDHHDTYDAVLSRALAPLDRLIAWCNPLRSPRGAILALKGRSAQEEVDSVAPTLREKRLRAEVLVVRATRNADPTTVVRLTAR
jgi:16S rRNA (guanine527-N7)-methyltransferase